MSEAKLLPCPFCGGEAAIKMLGNDHILATHRLTARSKIRCGCEISCSAFGCTIKVVSCTLSPPLEKTREWAIAAWNTRVDPVKTEMYAALKSIFGFFESGEFVRDTSRDFEDGWHLRMLPLMTSLVDAKAALAKAEGHESSSHDPPSYARPGLQAHGSASLDHAIQIVVGRVRHGG